MRAIMNVIGNTVLAEEYLEQTPADKAEMEIVSLTCDSKWGTIAVDTLEYKSSHPHRFEWPDEVKSWLLLDRLQASKLGKGYGAKLLKIICKVCDKHHVTIYTDASPYDAGLGPNALVRFYKTAGFEEYQPMQNFASGTAMVRFPR